MITAGLLRAAHGDAWHSFGELFTGRGGGATVLPGVRLMASGIDHPQWNSGDVDDVAQLGIDDVRRWYAGFGVPWGLRVPADARFPYGRRIFTLPLMGADPGGVPPVERPPDVSIRRATSGDLETVIDIDAVAFLGEDSRRWLELIDGQPPVTVALATIGGVAIATGVSLFTDEVAGPALYLAGIGVVPEARRRGVASALTSWLIDEARPRGPNLVHLFPATDGAAALYRKLGFVGAGGVDVYIDC